MNIEQRIDKFIIKWTQNKVEDCGCVNSKDYLQFQKEYKQLLKNIANEIGFEFYNFLPSHNEFSAILKSCETGQYYYIYISDVRYFPNKWFTTVLYRTMKHEKDWTGGPNRYSTLRELGDNLTRLNQFNS